MNKQKEELKPWQKVRVFISYNGHDVHITDMEHGDNSITLTKVEAEYIRDALNYLTLNPRE